MRNIVDQEKQAERAVDQGTQNTGTSPFQVILVIILLACGSGISQLISQGCVFKRTQVTAGAVDTIHTPQVESRNSTQVSTYTEATVIAQISAQRSVLSKTGLEGRELARACEKSADDVLATSAMVARKLSSDMQRQTRLALTDFYSKAAHLYKSIGSAEEEIQVYEKLERQGLASDSHLTRHTKLIDDTRVSSFLASNTAISLGLCYMDRGFYAEAEKVWKRGLDRAAGSEGSAGLNLARLLADLYANDKRFAEEEPCRKLSVRLGLQYNGEDQYQSLRDDTLKWQKCLISLGRIERAKKLNKFIASQQPQDAWDAVNGTM